MTIYSQCTIIKLSVRTLKITLQSRFSLYKKECGGFRHTSFFPILTQKNPYKNCTEYFAYYIDIYAYIVYNPYRVEIPDKDCFRSLIYLLKLKDNKLDLVKFADCLNPTQCLRSVSFLTEPFYGYYNNTGGNLSQDCLL